METQRGGPEIGHSWNPAKRNFIGVYSPSTSRWFLRMSRPGWIEDSSADISFHYGGPDSSPLVGDWDGDGRETQGVWANGQWSLCNTLGKNTPDLTFGYGQPTDIPLVGDWDGNGTSTPGVFRNGTFLLRNSNTRGEADITFRFGEAGDVPIAGDWDGDGIDTVGVYRPSLAMFLLSNVNVSNHSPDIVVPYGSVGDRPIVGNFDGDRIPSIGVKRGSQWFLKGGLRYVSSDGSQAILPDIYDAYGNAEDLPIAGNWNPDASDGYSTVPSSLSDFFPLAVDHQHSSTFAKWKARGINTVIRVPDNPVADSIDRWTAVANRLGLKMIRGPRPNPADDAREAGLLAWELFDEPDGDGTTRVQGLIDRYSTLKGYGSRPVFFNFIGTDVLDPREKACNGPGDSLSAPLNCYRDFINAEDWVSNDIYPLNTRKPLSALGQTLDKLERWSSGKPQFAYVEASNAWGPGEWTPPTPDQFRAEVWLAIVHGARGLFYFPHGDCATGDCSNTDAMPGDVVAEMTTQNSRIAGLASVLQSEINPPSLGFVARTPLEVTWRQVGSENYYFVLNLSPASITQTMRVQGFTPQQKLAVMFENRSVGIPSEQSFTDTFGPYAVHIYRSR
jgi:hypothetical protein